jgi:hypothetical protein
MYNTFSQYDPYLKNLPLSVKHIDDLKHYGLGDYEPFINFRKTNSQYIELSCFSQVEEPYVDENPWKYLINPWNFRGVWNFEDSRKQIGFFGCSFTFGEGINSPDTFVELVSSKLNFNGFNFGIGGSGIERIARTFSAVTRVIDLDYAIITLPGWHRVLHQTDDGSLINLVPGYPHRSFEKLSNKITSFDEDFHIVRALSFINWIYNISLEKDIKILFSSWDHPLTYCCKKILPDITIDNFPNIDDRQARDKMHPGTKSQKAHADQIIKAFYDKTWI